MLGVLSEVTKEDVLGVLKYVVLEDDFVDLDGLLLSKTVETELLDSYELLDDNEITEDDGKLKIWVELIAFEPLSEERIDNSDDPTDDSAEVSTADDVEFQ
ncbi:hypothetical protein WICMUC_002876 [Wickerhamomyces mucosus]|uniref:Uncharacterized protein n=1 Tax=Wickerhamomyces mucosus TaxID=1378264 RepID=A0A9P8PPN4_9ASCO|nr:hypothetical protein WICMUC_002876 [Wickerhamomyces mucosus]